jgi:hypothetical protein
VMDSPASNALAHFLHLTLFLLGDTVTESAQPTSVAAELYRANRIENYDTCSLRFTVTHDVPVLLAFTHACATPVDPIVTIEAELAQISYISGRRIEIHRGDAQDEMLPLSANPHRHMLSQFRDWVRQGPGEQLNSTLEMARAHVVAVNAASEAAAVIDVPTQYVKTMPAPDGTRIHVIEDIVEAMRVCVSGECSLDQTGLAPWAQPPARIAVNGYHHFAGPASGSVNGKLHAETFVTAAKPTSAVSA